MRRGFISGGSGYKTVDVMLPDQYVHLVCSSLTKPPTPPQATTSAAGKNGALTMVRYECVVSQLKQAVRVATQYAPPLSYPVARRRADAK